MHNSKYGIKNVTKNNNNKSICNTKKISRNISRNQLKNNLTKLMKIYLDKKLRLKWLKLNRTIMKKQILSLINKNQSILKHFTDSLINCLKTLR